MVDATGARRAGRVVVTWTRPVDTAAARALLAPHDLERLARLRKPEDVSRFVTGRALLRSEVAAWMDVDVIDISFTATCWRCGSDHGKPFARVTSGGAGPDVSLAHSGDLVVVAVTEAGAVGVDVEAREAASFDRFHEVGLHPLERAVTPEDRTAVWVRKESVLKATGDGLQVDPRRLRVSERDERPELLGWEGEGMPRHPVWMFDVETDGDHLGCVTVLSDQRPELIVRQAAEAALSA